ncbi:MAG: hypothetical protein J6Y34_05490, partial [Bacteroidales bacterium]|nr:hypothetical protein [Bacteroidales bacterium]
VFYCAKLVKIRICSPRSVRFFPHTFLFRFFRQNQIFMPSENGDFFFQFTKMADFLAILMQLFIKMVKK